MVFYQAFRITGVANSIILDAGVGSTEGEKKRLLAINMVVDEHAGNNVQAYHERAKIMDIPDVLVDVEAAAFTTDISKPGARLNRLEVGLDIPVGEAYKAAIQCNATAADLIGFYEYELIK